MLSMAPVQSVGGAATYFAKDNYYTNADAVETSRWEGKGASALGLDGSVEFAPFEKVLQGELPDGAKIQPGREGKHRPGLDLTFSAPKSLSLLAYIGGDKRLLAANRKAAQATMAWAEKHLAATRTEVGGKMQVVKTGNLMIALFAHDTSRALDPQAHIHAVIANATRGPDGKWRSLYNDALWKNNTLLGSIYHSYLRTEVEKLGYATEKAGKHASFEISGISREAIEAFSTRRRQILETTKEKLAHVTAAALRAVTVRTRSRKEPIADRGVLYEQWLERAEKIGLDLKPIVEAAQARAAASETSWSRVVAGMKDVVERGKALAGHFAALVGSTPSDPLMSERPWLMKPVELAAAQAVASAVRHLSQREAAFKTDDIYKAALAFDLPVTIDGVEACVAQLVRRGALVKGKGADADYLTTREALQQEDRIVAAARLGRGASAPIVPIDQAGERLQEAAKARKGFGLNPGQEAAGRLILASSDRTVNVQGVAGAGKSTVLGAVADVARAEGYQVHGLGFQNKLADSDASRLGFPTASRLPFRFDVGHHSDLKPASLPI